MHSGEFENLYSLLYILKDSNAATHSVDSDIFYVVIFLPAPSKIYINLYFLKQCQIYINFMHDDASMASCDKGS